MRMERNNRNEIAEVTTNRENKKFQWMNYQNVSSNEDLWGRIPFRTG